MAARRQMQSKRPAKRMTDKQRTGQPAGDLGLDGRRKAGRAAITRIIACRAMSAIFERPDGRMGKQLRGNGKP